MVAFRFIAVISVGFILLLLSFLLHVGHGRLEIEGRRVVAGPELRLAEGESVEWTVDLGAAQTDEAWPGPQRQPRLYLEGAEGLEVRVDATAAYALKGDDTADAFVGGGPRSALAGAGAALEFGPLWMSWEHPLTVRATVAGGGAPERTARLVLRGEVTETFLEARSIARAVWAAASVIGAMSFALLLVSLRGTWGTRRDGAGAS